MGYSVDILTSEIILESISDGVFTISNDWRITYFNNAAEKITGIAREVAIGLSCCEVFKSNMCESHCPLKHTFETEEPVVDDVKNMVDALKKRDIKKALMYHTFYIEHLSCDHEILKTAHPSYFPHL